MWHVPGEIHNASLSCMRRMMRWCLVQPPRPQKQLKLLYTLATFFYLGYVMRWRFSFNYGVVYERTDTFSRVIDLLNFATLIGCHLAISMELIWRDRGEQIEQQLERVRYVLRVQFGYKVKLGRMRRYANTIYWLLLFDCFMLLAMTVYNNLITNTALLLIYAFYSEVVLLIRLSEFSLYAALILVFYVELCEASSRFILELDKTRFEVWSLRRLSLERLSVLQHLFGLLWNTVRSVESNFALSVLVVMLKYFVDTSVLPYWMFVNRNNHIHIATTYYCATEEICKLLSMLVPCLLCTQCELQQRQLRSVFHGVTTDRQNAQLNIALYRISAQLGQEKYQFSAGGFLLIKTETLGKFIFGMISYIVICIQFRLSLIDKSPADAVENFVTAAQIS